jgi:hypothetical protein
MKQIFLVLFLALALALSGCVGPKDAPKGVIENDSFELVYSRGFDLLMDGRHETSRIDTVAGEYSCEICPDAGVAQTKSVPLNLSDSEKKTIRDSFIRNRIWEIDHDFTENCQPDTASFPDRVCQSTTPGDYSILVVTWKGQSKKNSLDNRLHQFGRERFAACTIQELCGRPENGYRKQDR